MIGTDVALLQTRAATPLPTEGKVNRLISEVDVAVIGAGAAGIAAARRLVEARTVSVLVLASRDRSGGRARTIEAEGPRLRVAAFGRPQCDDLARRKPRLCH